MARKATKKISAVPKSLISARHPTQNRENRMVKIRFRRAKRRSMVSAPARMKATFTNSEGWKEMGPRATQLRAPNSCWPKSTLKASRAQAAMATGQRSFLATARSRRKKPRTTKPIRPSRTVSVCLASVSMEEDAVMLRHSVVRKKARLSRSKPVLRNRRYRAYSTHMAAQRMAKQPMSTGMYSGPLA